MAPPALKRRKLEHSDESDESEGSFADNDHMNGADSAEELLGEDRASDSDGLIDGSQELDGGDSTSDEDTVSPKTGHKAEKRKKISSRNSTDNKPKPTKSLDSGLQDGVYTAETFKSNIFKLQVDDLLDQVKPKYGKKEAPAENAMRTLKNMIEQIPSRDPLTIVEAEKALKSAEIAIPFPNPRPPKDAKYKLQYERPSSINVTGSFALRTATKSDDNIAIDLVVTMPRSLFQEKDYLNHRYFYKRAFYLACLAAGLKDSEEHEFKISFDFLNGNQLQPILVVLPNGNGDSDDFSGSKCQIHIVLAVPENTFAPGKLLPSSNCVRPKGSEDDPNKALAPTPFYNSTLQSDASITAYLKLFHSAAGKCDAYKDACILGRIWLKQRGFGSRLRTGGFGNFEWAALIALLLQPNLGADVTSLSSGYSSYQLFKATLQILARHDLSKKPFVFQAHNVALPKANASPIFFDGTRGLNILFKMTSWSYSRLRQEAKTTVDILSKSAFDQFDSTFILKTELLRLKYDAVLELPLSGFGFDPSTEEYDQNLHDACQKIHDTLSKALTDRVTSITFTMPNENRWPVSSRRPLEKQQKIVLVTFATDPSNANRTIDHGPPAEEKQKAAVFRKFWGEKAELRRFKDGSILESVVWPNKDTSATIIEQIVFYILKQHLGTTLVEQARFTSDFCAHLIPVGRIQGQSGVSAFLPIMNAFAVVEKNIRELEELPLQIRHIRAADPQLRYASIEPPVTGHDAASVVLQFEGSGRWPDDLCAIQRTKIAFLLKLSDLLSTAQPSYATRVGLENPSLPAQNQAYLDITVPPGFTFRIRIHHDREATLLERQLKDKALDAQSRESAAVSLSLYKREFLQTPSHTQALQTLCTRFSALSPTIRLMKRWFASHLLSPHFAPELIELLVVRTFLEPYPWTTPSCATTGFLRTLAWLSRWDWRHTPMIVDFSTTFSSDPGLAEDSASRGMKVEDIERIQTRFEAWRRIDPAMNRVAVFVATNLDEEGNSWTDKGRPEKVVAARLTALAKAATQAVRVDEDHSLAKANGNAGARRKDSLDPESLFISQPGDFDLVIDIDPKHTVKASRKHKASDVKFKNLEIQQLSSAPQQPSSSLPALYVQELSEIYCDAIIWFWDPECIDKIVGIWNPVETAQRSWKVKVGWNSVPVATKRKNEGREKDVEVKINKAAVVHEIRRLGGDLVKSITVNR